MTVQDQGSPIAKKCQLMFSGSKKTNPKNRFLRLDFSVNRKMGLHSEAESKQKEDEVEIESGK